MKEWQRNAIALCIVAMFFVVGIAALGLVGRSLFSWVDGYPEPDYPEPTAETLHQMRKAPYPVYWLGRSFQGLKLTTAQIYDDSASFGYGPLGRCDSFDGCPGPPVVIVSSAHTEDPFFPPTGNPKTVCFRYLRGAAVLTCGDSDEFHLYTGRGSVFIRSEPGFGAGSGTHVARTLISINPVAGSTDLLPPPAPLRCHQFRKVIRWFVIFAQRHFGPAHCKLYPKYSPTR